MADPATQPQAGDQDRQTTTARLNNRHLQRIEHAKEMHRVHLESINMEDLTEFEKSVKRSQAERTHVQYLRGLTEARVEEEQSEAPSGPTVPSIVPPL